MHQHQEQIPRSTRNNFPGITGDFYIASKDNGNLVSWNRFQWRSLRTRVTLLSLGIFLVGIWSVAFYASWMLSEDMRHRLGEQQFSAVSSLAAHVNEELGDRLRALELIASTIDASMLDKQAALQKRLEERLLLRILFNGGAYIARADGTAIADVPLSAGRIGTNYMDRDYMAGVLKEGKATIGEPVMDRMLNVPIFNMTIPIRNVQGKVIGALVGVTELGKPNFLDSIVKSKFGKTGGYVLNAPQHGMTVTATDKSLIMRPNPAPGVNPLFDSYVQGYEGYGNVVDSRGLAVHSAAKGIPVAGWILIARIPAEEATAPINAMKQRMLLLTILVTLLAGGLIGWMISLMLRRQFLPMMAATEMLVSLASTNQSPQPLTITTQDEIGELIAGFNRLLKALAQRQEALEESERFLRESEARFRSLTEMSSDFYWESDAEHRLTVRTESKREAAESVSVQAIAIGKRRWEISYLSPDESGWQQHRATLDAHLPFREFEIARPRANGAVHHVSISGDPVFDSSGGFKGYHGVGTDISERKRTEAALRKSQEQFRIAQELSPDGFTILRPVRDAQERVVDFTWVYENAAIARLNGTEQAAVVGRRLLDLFPGHRDTPFLRAYQQVAESGETCIFEADYSGESMPKRIWFRVAVVRMGSDIAVLAQDITERKRAEETRAQLEAQLRESQKMEAIGTLAGGIAHDFNNILATILGNVELARQDASTNLPALESLNEIRKAAARARDLVQQILSFSRRQATKRDLIALTPVVEECVRLLRATLPARLTLDVRCDTDLPCALADVNQLKQILINLVTNAMQAMPSRPGRIGIRLDAVMLDAALAEAQPVLRAMHEKRPGRALRLAVSDDGPGMDAATLERVFEPFFTTKPVDEGTGLGLSVVHGIVQAHEGAIVVESAPGKGTTFTLYLPAAETQAGTPAPEPGESAAATAPMLSLDGGQRILYVDDDESLVLLVRRLLERRGYRISGYTVQSEALAALRADPAAFDLVVTDYNMPGMSGLDLAREVRAIRADLPVAVASGFVDEELRAQAGGAGVRELIFKADTAEDLCEAFARLAQTVGEQSKSS